MTRRLLVISATVVALFGPVPAQAACPPTEMCAGSAIVRGINVMPSPDFLAFKWSLTYEGVVAGESQTPQTRAGQAQFWGKNTSVDGNLVAGLGTLTIFNPDSSTKLFVVPMRYNAVRSVGANGVVSASGALVPLGVGGGHGASFALTDGELYGALHAVQLRELSVSTVVSTISAPQAFAYGQPVQVSGRVRTSTGTNLPGVPVDVMVDGEFAERVTTANDGSWATSVAFSDADTHSVQAIAFREAPYAARSPVLQIVPLLQLTVDVSGAGAVTGANINCSTSCSYEKPKGSSVALTAVPAASTNFAGWSGACSGLGGCTVLMDQARLVGATFVTKTFTLTTSKIGTGTGTITSAPAGISCGATCAATYPYGTSVSLTATPGPTSTFSGWTGACSGSGSCIVSMTEARSVTAIFSIKSYTLSVSRSGNGAGAISSTPGGISCGSTCSASFNHGTVVSLGQTPDASSIFSGWSGACSGTGACNVTMDQARSVTANFTLKTYQLSVGVSGNGTVTSTPAGISCPGACSAGFDHGTMVTLSQSPNIDSNFTGWSGACTGTGACTVSMTQARNVTANFAIKTFLLTVNKTGNGTGLVESDIGGMDCGPTCSVSYNYGTQVTLSATPGPYSTFVGWTGGGCSGVSLCTVTMTQARTVAPIFSLINADVVEIEPNDTLGTAQEVALPVRVAGSAASGDVDLVKITLATWTKLHIETFDETMSGCSGLDTVVSLMNAGGYIVTDDDDGGVNFCSLIDDIYAPGVYYIEVKPYGTGSLGSYRLSLMGAGPNTFYESNDTWQTAYPISSYADLVAAIDPVGDRDYYTFTLGYPETIRFQTFQGDGTTCDTIDTFIHLFNSSGTEIAADDDDGIGLCSDLNVGLGAGTYSIMVEDYGNNGTIPLYRLFVSSYYGD